ncbi:hypothetical protein M758_8G118700 [Ceratodon purpureus]|nr:hypothetical protein M758_8G118700 [Ceratodon purpureus]
MTSSTGAHTGQEAGSSSHKRKRAGSDVEEVVDRKYGLDIDILDCPICLEPFVRPVYQCKNGHTICFSCCKKLAPKRCPTCSAVTGKIRCIAIEKILESLLVSCKNAEHGCKKMLNRTDMIEHENHDCLYEPFPCPVENCVCTFCSDVGFIAHMTEVHQVPTVHGTGYEVIGIGMISWNQFVLVDVKGGGKNEKSHLFFLVHRQVHSDLGDIFFCSSFQGRSNKRNRYKLQAEVSFDRSVYSIDWAVALDLRHRGFTNYRKQHFLLVPFRQPRPTYDNYRLAEVEFSVCQNDEDEIILFWDTEDDEVEDNDTQNDDSDS